MNLTLGLLPLLLTQVKKEELLLYFWVLLAGVLLTSPFLMALVSGVSSRLWWNTVLCWLFWPHIIYPFW